MKWKVNTSNPGKLEEFQIFFGDIEVIGQDLPEPEADPITIIRYKASQFDNVIVDDVGLYIEGEEVGTNIRWMLERMPDFIGKKASFVCLLGLHRNQQVEIFEGRQSGRIVAAQGASFGFNKHFLPDGSDKTFGEEKPDALNPRWHAVRQILDNKPTRVEIPLFQWDGLFQGN